MAETMMSITHHARARTWSAMIQGSTNGTAMTSMLEGTDPMLLVHEGGDNDLGEQFGPGRRREKRAMQKKEKAGAAAEL